MFAQLGWKLREGWVFKATGRCEWSRERPFQVRDFFIWTPLTLLRTRQEKWKLLLFWWLNSLCSNTVPGHIGPTRRAWFRRIWGLQAERWLLQWSLQLFPGKRCWIWKAHEMWVPERGSCCGQRCFLRLFFSSKEPSSGLFSLCLLSSSSDSLLGFVLFRFGFQRLSVWCLLYVRHCPQFYSQSSC